MGSSVVAGARCLTGSPGRAVRARSPARTYPGRVKPLQNLPGDPPMIMPQDKVLDASALDPGVRWLVLDKMTIPAGELAKLPALERLVISYPRGTELDLSGCRSLRELYLTYASKLEAIRGLEDAAGLEQLLITSCRQLREVPDLGHATRLTDIEIGPLDVAPSIAPALSAPRLEMLELRGPVPLAPGDVERIRDHPTLLAFQWAAIKVPTAVAEHVREVVGRPITPPRRATPDAAAGRSSRRRRAAPLRAGTRGPLLDGHRIRRVLSGLHGRRHPAGRRPDFGSAVTRIEIDLFPEEDPRGEFASRIRRWNSFREQLPEIRFRRSAGSVLIRASSGLNAPRLRTRHASTAVPLFRQACTEVRAALELLRERLTPQDDFDLEGFLSFCDDALDRIPATQGELDALDEAAQNRRRQARQAEASARPFPGWMPGEPVPEGI
ncbi:hypothetical protein [Microbacterium sp. NIBRBAC000506063]|uniref:hypothetical protein n=1 Tax=Microbacterium sp. NIBRBAC000506063 TaxID=2734618 RepID=UPI001BB80440|nr:hypothetical protein [Microbacterium sp. NIBRBAC000506063]QTV80446.1 hypothetical protein KAE78_05905 [Microbacterium sp. NIBRBAC000506063]